MASVAQRKWTRNGKVSSSWQVSWVENGHQQKKAGFRTKRLAEAWATTKEASILDGTSREQSHKKTVAEAAQEYLSDMERRVTADIISDGHLTNIKTFFRGYICKTESWMPPQVRKGGRPIYADKFHSPLGHFKVGHLRPKHIEAFRDDLVATGMNYRTVKAIVQCLHQFLDFCRRKDLIAVNPATRIGVEVPRSMRDEKVYVPSRSVMKDLLAASPPAFRLMVEFAATTGLRSGEMRALAWNKLDVDARTVNVVRAINSKGEYGPPKSAAGVRTVPFSRDLAERLRIHRESSVYDGRDDLVFAGRGGRPTGDHRLLKELHRVQDRIGQRHFTWHALRHFAVSAWLASGLNLKCVSTLAGHSDITTTANIYAHLFPEDDVSEKIDSVGSDLIA